MFIYVKLLKKWGEYKIGDVVRFAEQKAKALIARDIGVEVKESAKAVNPLPPIENTMANPVAETAVAAPQAQSPRRGRPPKTVAPEIGSTSVGNATDA